MQKILVNFRVNFNLDKYNNKIRAYLKLYLEMT